MTADPTRLLKTLAGRPEEPPADAGLLVCLKGPEVGRRWALRRGVLLVGRDPDADVSLADDTVSWHHCELAPTPDGIRLRDLGSTNGTRVDGRPVADPVGLVGGERLDVGGVALRFLEAAGTEAGYHDALQRQARMDPLTGAWDRRRLREVLEHERARALRHGRPLHLMMLDVDHFKRINDGWGHPAGDAVLRELAALVASTVRATELFARYGGEEFALVVPESPTAHVVAHAEKIRARVAARAFEFEGSRLPVTVSIGVAAQPAGGGSVDALIARADARLYAAKAAGRNRVVSDDAGQAA